MTHVINLDYSSSNLNTPLATSFHYLPIVIVYYSIDSQLSIIAMYSSFSIFTNLAFAVVVYAEAIASFLAIIFILTVQFISLFP